ncbi:HK97 family phage prohead protease [Clostridium saudiense]|uniref:HK97 family phage prohead protease n=1 Tax=Clostridium saudiense TaxID=1414720 RepID=A0ABS2FLN4_9CLOT|nr:HK97 family phage prohead protease [Clostridium saudiense]MBM6820871.1 HK97 family phage prohead protease [Clostridium saudiense]
MKIEIRENGLNLEGYINVSERPSKPLRDSEGQFIEVVREGVMGRAIQRRNIKLLFNHDWMRVLGDTNSNLQLQEDSIGLRFRAFITDSEVIEKAKKGLLKGCSFGFRVLKQSKENINGICKRYLEDIELFEVSILDREPAYSGCLAEIRSLENEDLEVREIPLEIQETTKEEIVEENVEEAEVAEDTEVTTEDEVEEKIEAQEEIVEQNLDLIENYSLWLWVQKNKK